MDATPGSVAGGRHRGRSSEFLEPSRRAAAGSADVRVLPAAAWGGTVPSSTGGTTGELIFLAPRHAQRILDEMQSSSTPRRRSAGLGTPTANPNRLKSAVRRKRALRDRISHTHSHRVSNNPRSVLAEA